jgi:hypothetical protein
MTLSKRLDEHQRLTVADACAVAAEVTLALEYIHERQQVHLDFNRAASTP